MNLRHLEAFREVMLGSSVSGAARSLGRTQPAISATIADLERDVGYRLFERKGGRLHPVREAHFLLPEAGQVLASVSALERSMSEGGGVDAGELRIA